jgi:hypothetical protein
MKHSSIHIFTKIAYVKRILNLELHTFTLFLRIGGSNVVFFWSLDCRITMKTKSNFSNSIKSTIGVACFLRCDCTCKHLPQLLGITVYFTSVAPFQSGVEHALYALFVVHFGILNWQIYSMSSTYPCFNPTNYTCTQLIISQGTYFFVVKNVHKYWFVQN